MRKVSLLFNFLIVGLIVLLGGLVFCNEKIGYGNVATKIEKMTPVIADYHFAPDSDEIWEFMSNATNMELSLLENVELEEQIEEEAKAKKISAEDPSKIVKKQQKLKGVAKETTAKQDVQRYETNETSLGIDVSTWQGKINWSKVKASGISFAMIRAGFRGTVSGKITEDNQFENNIKGAIANNINVGVYFFSMAKDKEEALEEAKWLYEHIKDYDISYPVAIDIEIFDKLASVNVFENDDILSEVVYWELQMSIPKRWITNILPSFKVKAFGYVNESVLIFVKKDKRSINNIKYFRSNEIIERILIDI